MSTPSDVAPQFALTHADIDSILARAYLRAEMTAALIGAGCNFLAAGLAGQVSALHQVQSTDALPEGGLDVVFAALELRDNPQPLAALQDWVRLLKPGGRLVVIAPLAASSFERAQLRAWFQQAGLVNVIVDAINPSAILSATGTLRLPMRAAVQQAYTAAALTGCGCGCGESETTSSCCGEAVSVPVQDVMFERAYSPEERSTVPAEAAQISLGCGNPVALAALRPGEVVLDIGSGGGIDAFLAARRVAPTGRVIGVDMTPAMLQRARRAAKKAGITNVTFRHGQAEKLPVEDGTVDVILSNCVINLCEDKGLVFGEAYRALKPGGRLEVSDIVTQGAFSTQARQDAGEWAGCISGALPAQEYLDLIAQAGFTGITTRRSTVMGDMDGVIVSSAIISACKPGGEQAGSENNRKTGTAQPCKDFTEIYGVALHKIPRIYGSVFHKFLKNYGLYGGRGGLSDPPWNNGRFYHLFSPPAMIKGWTKSVTAKRT